MDHDALIAKLQKLLALAQRGEGGEAVNARSLLDKMLVQYGIDEASLTDIRTLRCATDYEDEQELLVIVISFALQIPTAQVWAEIVERRDALGMDLTMTVEQHGLTAALFQYHRVGLEKSIKQLVVNQEKQKDAMREEIEKLTAKIRTLKAIFNNLEQSAAKARASILCAYANLNNLVDYSGWSSASTDGADAIFSAADSCVRLDPNPNQLPAQRLGTTNDNND